MSVCFCFINVSTGTIVAQVINLFYHNPSDTKSSFQYFHYYANAAKLLIKKLIIVLDLLAEADKNNYRKQFKVANSFNQTNPFLKISLLFN